MNTLTPIKKQYITKVLKPRIKNLAEAIILQSLEDLWHPDAKSGSRRFFEGSGFKICSEIAGLDTIKQYKILHKVGGRSHGRNLGLH